MDLPLFIDSALAMLWFYHLGRVFSEHGLQEKEIPMLLSLMLLALYGVLIYQLMPTVNIKENVFPHYLWLLSLWPITSLFYLCKKIHSAFLMRCGVASLVIMGLHHPIYDAVLFPMMNRLPLPAFIECSFMVVIAILLLLFVERIIMKYCPALMGKF